MKGVKAATICDLQTVYNLADIISDLCNEKPSEKLLERIKNSAKRIKKTTEEYNG
jgi:hypothetical protein